MAVSTAAAIFCMALVLNVSTQFLVAGAIVIDGYPPITNSSLSGTLGNNGWYISNVSVHLAAVDNGSGVNSTLYNLDHTGYHNYTGKLSIGEGRHNLSFYSVDNATNAEVAHNISFNVDKTAPSTAIAFAGTMGSNGWYTSDVLVTLTPSDGTSGINKTQYSFDGTNWTTGASFTISAEGVHAIYYKSTDNAGNKETAKLIWVGIDKSGPIVSYQLSGYRGSRGWFETDVDVTLTSSGGASGLGINATQYSLDGTHWNNYTGTFKVGMSRSKSVFYRCTDNAGHTVSGNIFIYFPPVSVDMGGIIGNTVYQTATPTPTPTATPTATPTIAPTTTVYPSTTTSPTTVPETSSGGINGTAVVVLLGVLALITAAGVALYFFMLKPK